MYTLARIGLFVASFLVIEGVWLVVAGSADLLVPLLLAAVVSAVASYYLLSGPRTRFAARVDARAPTIAAALRGVPRQGRPGLGRALPTVPPTGAAGRRTTPGDRAWVNEAVRRVEADSNRSADTHLLRLPAPGRRGTSTSTSRTSRSHPTGCLKHRLARSLFLYALCNGWIRRGHHGRRGVLRARRRSRRPTSPGCSGCRSSR